MSLLTHCMGLKAVLTHGKNNSDIVVKGKVGEKTAPKLSNGKTPCLKFHNVNDKCLHPSCKCDHTLCSDMRSANRATFAAWVMDRPFSDTDMIRFAPGCGPEACARGSVGDRREVNIGGKRVMDSTAICPPSKGQGTGRRAPPPHAGIGAPPDAVPRKRHVTTPSNPNQKPSYLTHHPSYRLPRMPAVP